MKRKFPLHGAGLLVLGLVLTSCGDDNGNGEELSLTLAYDQPQDSSYGIMADEFADTLYELSDGTIEVGQYPGGSLGDEPETIEDARAGSIDLVFASMGNISTAVPEAAVFSLHYLYEDEDHLMAGTTDPQVWEIFADMVSESAGDLHGLGVTTAGFRSTYATEPIEDMGDLEGVRFRIQPSTTEEEYWGAYGALPTTVDFSELYTALQTGAVDGAENTPAFYQIAQHHEVATYLSLTQHIGNQIGSVISQDTWESLSEEQQEWVTEAFHAGAEAGADAALEANDVALDELQEAGVEVLEPDVSEMQDIALGLTDEEAEALGEYAQEVVEMTRSLVE
ncbi:TRAP transporter substrate-binding protein [Nesterenkonia populi]